MSKLLAIALLALLLAGCGRKTSPTVPISSAPPAPTLPASNTPPADEAQCVCRGIQPPLFLSGTSTDPHNFPYCDTVGRTIDCAILQ